MRTRIRPSATSGDIANVVFNPQRNTPGEERLAVYASGYVARTREALAEVYEAIHHILGESAFSDLVLRYVQRHPSHDYNLSLVGRGLSGFLATDLLAEQLPFLSDLARLEWQVCQAFHAEERPSRDLNPAIAPRPLAVGGTVEQDQSGGRDVAPMGAGVQGPRALPVGLHELLSASLEDWARTRLIFHPSVGVVASAWPILDLWTARRQSRETIDLDLVDRPQRVLVFRQALSVRCELLETMQHVLLEALLAGQSLGAACECLAQQTNQAVVPLQQWCRTWVASGLIVGTQLTI